MIFPRLKSKLGPVAAAAMAVALGSPLSASAQDAWTPTFRSQAPQPKQKPPPAEPAPWNPPGTETPTPPPGPYQRPATRQGGVEKMDLDPVIAGDSSGLPLELWRGLDMKTLEGLLAAIELPPKSPSLHQLWRRMLLSSATPPTGAPEDHFTAIRLEALYRSGSLAEMADVGGNAGGPVAITLLARRDIGIGEAAKGCEQIKALADPRSGLPERLRGEAQLLNGYCAAVSGDKQGAGLAASLAREEGLEAELPLTILAGVADDLKPKLTLPKRILLLDYRFLELLGPVNGRQLLDRAEPALLAVLAADRNAEASTRVAAAEAALRINAIAPEIVAQTYREVAGSRRQGQGDADPTLRHASEFAATEQLSAAPTLAAALQSLMRDARRAGFGVQMGQVIATRYGNVSPGPQDGAIAETVAEALLAASKISEARAWANAGPHGLPHWMVLIDMVDPARKSWRFGTLSVLEDMAVRGRLGAELLHRLATVLDALDIDVPVPLWDAANRVAQPAGGYLPETGVLAELAESAKRRDSARTILLVMRALGPNGPDSANMLPLGDSIRALRKIGLETEARRLALEALLPLWPRYAQ